MPRFRPLLLLFLLLWLALPLALLTAQSADPGGC